MQATLKKYIFLALASLLAALIVWGRWPIHTWAANLLTNPGFNNPFNDIPGRIWNSQNEKIANGWQPFYIAANTYRPEENASKLHWMSSAQFGATFGGLDYHIEGDASQNMWSAYEFDAGVYQQVTGVTPGQAYLFDIQMVTYWRGPGYPDSDGIMVKRVGVDPYGGTDPTSSNIIWSSTDANDKAWVQLKAAATAESNTLTVFAKVQAPENNSFNHTDLDMVYFEDAHLDTSGPPPTTTLNASTSGETVNLNWSGTVAGGWSLKGYEVQYKDQAASNWTTLQGNSSTNTAGSFSGQATHSYTIRARTWQTSAGLDLPGAWVEQNITINEVVAGQVINYFGGGVDNATVTISGTVTNTVSANGGSYALATGPGTFDVAGSGLNGLVPPPVTQVTVPVNGVANLTLTLRPTGPAQGIANNDFETDLSNWNSSNSAAAEASTADYHTGQRSLLISNTVSLSQSNTVTNMNRPMLSFWYKNDASFTVEFLGAVGAVQTQTLSPAANWTFFTLDSGLGDSYSGPVGVNFNYSGGAANIFVDEVSIGAGPIKVYLPVIVRE